MSVVTHVPARTAGAGVGPGSPTLLPRLAPAGILLGLCAFLFLYGINAGELYQTEGLRALLAAEVLRGGNWVVPTLYGEPLLTKPPGMYAAIALLSRPFGAVSAATARLPSVLAATLTVLLFYHTFARAFGRRAGLAAAAILPASAMWLGRVPSAEIDMLQLAWVLAAVLCFVRALEAAESDGRQWAGWLWWPAALLCVAGGVLTKWTAPAFFYLTAVPVLWRRGRLRLLFGAPHLLGVVLAGAPCLAWPAAAVGQAGWPAFRDTVLREALQRLSPVHHPRPYPWGEVLLFPLKFLLANLPWSAFALLTLRPGFARVWDERGRRLLQTFHCWAWANLLFWSLAPGHHFRHAMPLQPGIAGLAALAWVGYLTGRLPWPLPRLRADRALAGMLFAWLVAKLVFVHAIIPDRKAGMPRARGEQVAALVPPGETLYLFRLKDEGILFYYGRPARRLPDPSRLPPSGRPRYCVLTGAEWQQWHAVCPLEALQWMRDEQGAPVVVVKVP